MRKTTSAEELDAVLDAVLDVTALPSSEEQAHSAFLIPAGKTQR